MKKQLIFILLGCFSQITIFATIITVDNNIPGMGDYTSLQAAHDAASSGDTILVFPSSVHYQAITLSKKLIIIGAGSEPIGNTKITYLTGNLVFGPGSDGSVVSSFGSAYGALVVDINANNIEINRVSMKNITVQENSIDIVIKGCQIQFFESVTLDLINIQSGCNVLILNNIIRGFYPNAGGIYRGISVIASNVWIKNNIIQTYSSTNGSYCLFYENSQTVASNNIYIGGNLTIEEPCAYNYNINIGYNNGYTTLPNCGTGNITGNNSTQAVFMDFDQGDYRLKPDSPAKGSGEGGTDMGIYGGDMPYVDGGYPDLPTIYHLEVPLTGNQQDGLDVIIKVKTNY